MKILVVSDLHLEFYRDGGFKFLKSLGADNRDVDAIVVAGDFATNSGLAHGLNILSGEFNHVVYTPGNHEFWGSSKDEVYNTLGKATRDLINVHWLRRSTVKLDGHRFIGTPLWFPDGETNAIYATFWSDFNKIADFASWVYEENEADVEYLATNVVSTDIVVTHYLPSFRSVSPQWTTSTSNIFFVAHVDALIEARQPKLWIHGHTHDSVSYKIGDTEVLCNPFGYAGHQTNPSFVRNLTREF